MRLMARPCLWLVLLVAGGASAASIAVEHSLDGGKSFVPAGSITLGAVVRPAGCVRSPPLPAAFPLAWHSSRVACLPPSAAAWRHRRAGAAPALR